MSYNGSGLFQINTSGQPVVAGTVITASAFNALTADLATGLTTAITKDGQTATTAQIPFAQGLRSTLTTDSTNSTSGSIITDGGLGVAKAVNIGTTLGVTGAVTGSSTITGTKLIPTGTSVTGNGMYLPAANTLGFSTNGTNAVTIDASGNLDMTGGGFVGRAANSSGIFFGSASVLPSTGTALSDNTKSMGSASWRWSVIYAGTGTINTSDANLKQDAQALTEAEQRVAVAIKGLIRTYRFKDAVAEKGDAARIHVGVMAQAVRDAFVAEGLDANRYALFCSDTWIDEDTNEEKTRLGVRYDELLAFVIAAL